MAGLESVAIFWDYENCRPASSVSGYSIVANIRRAAHKFGSVKLFKAYLELSESSSPKFLNLRSELQSSGVSLTDCPHNGQKDVADKMILVDMLSYAIDNPAPSTIILISGDRDFAYATSVLRLRRYRVVVMAPSVPSVHISLKSQASVFLDWNTDIIPKCNGYASAHSVGGSTLASPPHSPEVYPERRSSYPLAHPPSLSTLRPEFPVSSGEKTSRDGGDALHGMSSETWLWGVKSTNNCLSQKYWPKTRNPSVDCSSTAQLPTAIKPERLEESITAGKRPEPDSRISDPVVCSAYQTEQFPSSSSQGHVQTQRVIPPAVGGDIFKSPSVGSPPKQTLGKTASHNLNPEDSLSDSSSHSHGRSTSSLPETTSVAPGIPPTLPIPDLSPMCTCSHPPSSSKVKLDMIHTGHEHQSSAATDASKAPGPAQSEAGANGIDPPSRSVKIVPPRFRILVEKLEYHHTKGIARVSRSIFAEALKKQDPMVYEKAGVTKFAQYAAQAEKAGIVQLGKDDQQYWISLHPDWRRILSRG